MVAQVKEYCTSILTTPQVSKLPFHNLEHTEEVVQNVGFITTAMDCNFRDVDLLTVAAWFHDTGFSETYQNHEEVSQELARQFLKGLAVDKASIQQICNCIEATRMPQHPTNTLAEILCDADIFHISNLHFYYRKLLLRREWEVFCNFKMSDKEWHLLNLDFLEKFHFRSTYGKEYLEKGKLDNIKRVKRILDYY